MARFKFCFWLDADKDDELMLMEDIDSLKQQRQFVSTVRDGIRLMIDLRRGNFDVLIQLFPNVRHYLKDVGEGADFHRNSDDLRLIQEQLARLEEATLGQQMTNGVSYSVPNSESGKNNHGPKKLIAPAISKPVFDDDEELLTIKRDTSTTSANNFLKAAFALQQ